MYSLPIDQADAHARTVLEWLDEYGQMRRGDFIRLCKDWSSNFKLFKQSAYAGIPVVWPFLAIGIPIYCIQRCRDGFFLNVALSESVFCGFTLVASVKNPRPLKFRLFEPNGG